MGGSPLSRGRSVLVPRAVLVVAVDILELDVVLSGRGYGVDEQGRVAIWHRHPRVLEVAGVAAGSLAG